MISVFFESLFTGRIIFLMIATFLVGFGIGFSRVGAVGLIFAVPVALFFQAWLFFTASYMQALDYIGRTGAAGFDVDDVFAIHMVLHPSLLLLSIWFGRSSKNYEDRERSEQAHQFPPSEFVRMINTLAAHPDLAAAGWFPQRWEKLSTDERLGWATEHIDALRDLWASGEETGLEIHGADLPMMLAVIDGGGQDR